MKMNFVILGEEVDEVVGIIAEGDRVVLDTGMTNVGYHASIEINDQVVIQAMDDDGYDRVTVGDDMKKVQRLTHQIVHSNISILYRQLMYCYDRNLCTKGKGVRTKTGNSIRV